MIQVQILIKHVVSGFSIGDFVAFLNAILHDKSALTRALLLLLRSSRQY